MQVPIERLFTNVIPTKWLGKIIQFPLVRVIIAFCFLFPVTQSHYLLKEKITDTCSEPTASILLFGLAIAAFVLIIVAYSLYTYWVERRPAHEISFTGSLKEFLTGLGIGVGLMCGTVLVLNLMGFYHIESVSNDWSILIIAFSRFGLAAFLEELLFRLIIFRLTEEWLGTWAALVIQLVLFGLAHLGNPSATLLASAAIAAEAGLLLTAAFMLTRRVWLIFGLHLAWNYFQSAVFGIQVSGNTFEGIIKPIMTGPDWLTGGAFGIEASPIAVLLCLAVGILILQKALSENQVCAPRWKRTPAKTL